LIVTFLGTGTSQGVPVIGCSCPVCQSLDPHDKRLRTSIMLETQGKTFVIDTGPDFRQQMLRHHVQQLDAVLFSHEHKDHTAGLDDIRAFNFKQQKDMPVYAHPRVQESLKREFAYIFAAVKYPGIPQVELHDLHNAPITIEGVDFIPIEVMHYKLPVLGFRIGDFTYITDAKTIAPEEKEKIKGSKVLVLNALQHTKHLSHLTLDEALELAEEMGAETTYFTHISHRLGLHRDVEMELPDNVELAYDGLVLEI